MSRNNINQPSYNRRDKSINPDEELKRKELQKIWEDFKREVKTKDFLFTSNRTLELSQGLGEFLASGYTRSRDDTITQITKFYNLVRIIEKQSDAHQSQDMASLQIKLHLLKAQVFYATSRGIISENVKEFLRQSLIRILAEEDLNKLKQTLKDFATFFEAVYAYFYFYKNLSKGSKKNE